MTLPSGLEVAERAAACVIADLVGSDYIARDQQGRRNLYRVRSHLGLKLPFVTDLEMQRTSFCADLYSRQQHLYGRCWGAT